MSRSREEHEQERENAKKVLFNAIRPLPLKHNWTFWYDRYQEKTYDDAGQLMEIAQFNTVPEFWRIMNNLPLEMRQRDLLHMFKKGVRPRWEDERNKDGGRWTFRVSQVHSREFFQHILLLLIGESLTPHIAEHDDICGVSISTRASSSLITIWNRFAPTTIPSAPALKGDTGSKEVEEMERGVERMKEAILREVRWEMRPQVVYYRVFPLYDES